MTTNIQIHWSYIMKIAKQCGKLRLQNKFKEADILETSLIQTVSQTDNICLGVTYEKTL